jgi:ankyrin repeat protein
MCAAEEGREDVVCALLDAGASVNAQAAFGWTAMCLAAGRGHVEVARSLVAAGADMGAKLDDGQTALTWAAEQEQMGAVHALLSLGAEPEYQGAWLARQRGAAALLVACAWAKRRALVALRTGLVLHGMPD